MCVSRFIRFVTWYFAKPEPVRDVSFIVDKKERLMLEEAIRTVNSIEGGWDSLRRQDFHENSYHGLLIKNGLTHPEHTADTIFATVYLLKHMANNWEEWVLRRSKTQDNDEHNKIILRRWIETHGYTEKTNNFIILSYLENLLRLTSDWSAADMQGSGADKLIFEIECVISRLKVKELDSFAKFIEAEAEGEKEAEEEEAILAFKNTDTYKVEVYKKIVTTSLPSDYELCFALWKSHSDFIQEFTLKEEEYQKHLTVLRNALNTNDLYVLQAAMLRFSINSTEIVTKLRKSPEYILAIGKEKELLCLCDEADEAE
jgi:hypothetical protein